MRKNQTVIESFCIGLKSTELSAKMLQKSFTTLTQAVEYVDQRSKNQQLQKFIAEHQAHATTSIDVVVLPVEKREFDK